MVSQKYKYRKKRELSHRITILRLERELSKLIQKEFTSVHFIKFSKTYYFKLTSYSMKFFINMCTFPNSIIIIILKCHLIMNFPFWDKLPGNLYLIFPPRYMNTLDLFSYFLDVQVALVVQLIDSKRLQQIELQKIKKLKKHKK